jgi:hypothetical protein
VVDPRTGRVYLIYFRENGPAGALAMMRSDDAGASWTSERTMVPFVRLTKYRSTRIRLGDIHPIVTAQDIIHGVSLTTYRLAQDGSLGTTTERRLDVFNMLGTGVESFGTGDYQSLLGLAQEFAAVYVRPNCGPASSTCPDAGRPRTDVNLAR